MVLLIRVGGSAAWQEIRDKYDKEDGHLNFSKVWMLIPGRIQVLLWLLSDTV